MAFEDWCVAHARIGGKVHAKIKLDDKVAFFQQMATLVSSGTPLLEALELCAQQNQSLRMQDVLTEIAAAVASGNSLHNAMMEHQTVFARHWIEVIQIAEVSGRMGPVLVELNKQIRESRDFMRKLTGSLMYPAVLVSVAVGVVLVLLWLVVPTFQEMFAELGAELPGITQFVIGCSNYVVQYGSLGVAAVVCLVLGFRWQLRSDSGRRRINAASLVFPVLGELMIQSAMYRFSSNLSLLLRSDVPLLDALASIQCVFDRNPVYRDAVGIVQSRVAAGQPLSRSLEETELFSTMLTDLTRTGEESGKMADVMEQLAPYYKARMNGLIGNLTRMIEPAIILVMGATIAVVMTSIYLPMFEMAGKVS